MSVTDHADSKIKKRNPPHPAGSIDMKKGGLAHYDNRGLQQADNSYIAIV